MEHIIIVGNDNGNALYTEHFFTGGINRAKKIFHDMVKSGAYKDRITLIMMAVEGQDLSQYQERAEQAGFNLKIYTSEIQVLNYLDDGEGNDRGDYKIANLVYMGHGFSTGIYVNFSNATGDGLPFSNEFFSRLNPSLFAEGAVIDINACRTAQNFAGMLSQLVPQAYVHASIWDTYWGRRGIGTYDYERGSALFRNGIQTEKFFTHDLAPLYNRESDRINNLIYLYNKTKK